MSHTGQAAEATILLGYLRNTSWVGGEGLRIVSVENCDSGYSEDIFVYCGWNFADFVTMGLLLALWWAGIVNGEEYNTVIFYL